MRFDQLPDPGQSDAAPSLGALNAPLDTWTGQRCASASQGETNTIIADSQHDFTSFSLQFPLDVSTWLGVLRGIVERVMNDLSRF
jgi:hypothetical protein